MASIFDIWNECVEKEEQEKKASSSVSRISKEYEEEVMLEKNYYWMNVFTLLKYKTIPQEEREKILRGVDFLEQWTKDKNETLSKYMEEKKIASFSTDFLIKGFSLLERDLEEKDFYIIQYMIEDYRKQIARNYLQLKDLLTKEEKDFLQKAAATFYQKDGVVEEGKEEETRLIRNFQQEFEGWLITKDPTPKQTEEEKGLIDKKKKAEEKGKKKKKRKNKLIVTATLAAIVIAGGRCSLKQAIDQPVAVYSNDLDSTDHTSSENYAYSSFQQDWEIEDAPNADLQTLYRIVPYDYEKGDTMLSIANQYGVDIDLVEEANEVEDFKGVLYVPYQVNKEEVGNYLKEVPYNQESLDEISNSYGVALITLQEVNSDAITTVDGNYQINPEITTLKVPEFDKISVEVNHRTR